MPCQAKSVEECSQTIPSFMPLKMIIDRCLRAYLHVSHHAQEYLLVREGEGQRGSFEYSIIPDSYRRGSKAGLSNVPLTSEQVIVDVADN